jgi:hypothetical protein
MALKTPRFVNEGDRVLAPFKGTYIWSRVVTACGKSVHVESINILGGPPVLDCWFRVDELYVE